MAGAFLEGFSASSSGGVDTTHIGFEHSANVLGKGGSTAPAIGCHWGK